MNLESARPAVPADRARLRQLIAAARAEVAGQRGGPLHLLREVRAVVDDDALLERADLVVVGEYAGAILGYAAVHRDDLPDGTTLAVLDDIYVETEGREVGVGEAMMDVVLAWCRAGGCRGLDAVALPGNRALKNFFERFGLTARAILVHRALGAEQ